MRRIPILLLLALTLAACSATKSATRPAPSPPAPATRQLAVVLDDRGLTFPPGPTPAGPYRISFEDRRTSAPGSRSVHLQFVVPGPRLVLFDVPAGTASTHTLLANMTPEVVYVDPGASPATGLLRPEDVAHRHPIGGIRVTNPLVIEATPRFPTPVT